MHQRVSATESRQRGAWPSLEGRLAALACALVVLVVSALVMALAPDFTVLLIGRTLLGIGVGTGIHAVRARRKLWNWERRCEECGRPLLLCLTTSTLSSS